MVEILNPSDLPSYKALIDECFGSSNDLEQYEKYRENAAYTVYVIKDGSIVAGSVTSCKIDLFTFDFQPCVMLFNVAVKRDYRGKNLARELIQYVIDDAKAFGYRSVSLTCLPDAHAAHKLYESLGFTRTGGVKFEKIF